MATPLLVALSENHIATAKALVSRGANMFVITKDKVSLLHIACFMDDFSMIHEAIAKQPKNWSHQIINCPLELACREGKVLAVEFLMDHGGQVPFTNTYFRVIEAGHLYVLRSMLERTKRFDITSTYRERFRHTLLTFAVRHNRLDIAKYLVESHQNLLTHKTPLRFSITVSNTDAVLLLLEHGADVMQQSYFSEFKGFNFLIVFLFLINPF